MVLFAREPGREAGSKGLGPAGRDLFASFALGWQGAARRAGGRLVVATPPEDIPAWRLLFPAESEPIWLIQRGHCLGERLAGIAADCAGLPGHWVIVGGDTPPSGEALTDAFEALERGAQAVLAPAADGGVSLIAVEPTDADLLRSLAARQRGVLAALEAALRARGRSLVLLSTIADVDGRRSLQSIVRRILSGPVRSLARRVLRVRLFLESRPRRQARQRGLLAPSGLRAPPAAV